MRLNIVEPDHIELAEALKELLMISDVTPDQAKVEAVVERSRRILKQEWEVAKWGMFTWPVLAVRAWWRQANDRQSADRSVTFSDGALP